MQEHHKLDIHPIIKGDAPMYVNEPWLIDASLSEYPLNRKQPDDEDDNIRVYIPLDINRDAILRRFDRIIAQYGEANEENERTFSL